MLCRLRSSSLLILVGIGLLLPCLALPAWAQDAGNPAATEERLESLRDQIERDRERLREVEAEEEATLERLDNLRREIALREELAATYEQRLAELRAERDSLQTELARLNDEMEQLREQYQERATHAYKYGRENSLALILSAESINEMLVRAQYLTRFAEQRREMLNDLESTMENIESNRSDLRASEEETEELLQEAEREQARLERLRQEEQQTIAELRSRQEEIQTELEEKQAAAAELEQRLRDMMADQGEEATASPESAFDQAELSASFEDNRGRLPWPVDGVVTEPYGDRTDPVHGTQTRHPGILIATNPQEEVRAVFDGTVIDVDFIPGYGTYLVVRHGDYMSAYSNFSDLYVTNGQDVQAGQVLGAAGTEAEPRGAGVFFAVFDRTENDAIDPMQWLGEP